MGRNLGLRRWGIALALVASLFLPAFVHAQSSDPGALNLTTSPLPISIMAKPGETVSKELRVKNSGTKPETLKVGLMKFTAYGEEGKPELKDREAGDDYFDWVSFSETKFTVQPNEWKSITMTVSLPKTAAFDYYYAVTFSRADSTVTAADRQAKVQGGTAILVLVEADVPGAVRTAQITSFTTSHKTYEFLPVDFSIKIKNTGNVHLAPTGNIFISQGKKVIDTIQVNATAGNVLPGSSRIFQAAWTNGFPVYETKTAGGSVVLKNGQPVKELSWKVTQIKNLRAGRYTAHLTMVYDDGHRDVPLDATVSFWVIPWRLIAIFVLIPLAILALIVYLVVSRRRYKKKAAQAVHKKK